MTENTRALINRTHCRSDPDVLAFLLHTNNIELTCSELLVTCSALFLGQTVDTFS